MITFERSFDYELIRRVLTHPRIWPHISDDYSPPPEQYKPVESDAIWYVLAKDDGRLLGLWMFVPQNGCTWEVHTALLPEAWGPLGDTAARLLPEWIWQNTPCLRIVTNVPENNSLALRYAQRVGMLPCGFDPLSYRKHGKLWGRTLLGLSSPVALTEEMVEVEACRQP